MRTHARLLLALSFVVAACGSGTHAPTGGGTHATTGGGDAPRISWSDRAVHSYLDGELDRAAAQADAALQLDRDDAHAMEVAARVALAKRDADKARSVLAAAHGPVLLRLRARAALLAGDAAAAVRDLEAVDGQDPADGWAVAMLPVLRAAGTTPLYAISGTPEAALPYVGADWNAVPFPVVHVTIDGHEVEALVSTAAFLTVLPRESEEAPAGAMIGRIELGGVVVTGVPAITRPFREVSAASHRTLGAVIGTDLLLRLHPTMDGHARTLTLRRAAPPAPAHEVATADYAAFGGGAVLAVRASVGDGPTGYWEVDTSFELPMALMPRTVSDAHVPPAQLRPAPGAAPEVKLVEGLTLRLGTAEIGGVPGVVGIVPDQLAEITGTRIQGILGQAIFGQMRVTIDTDAQELWLE